MEERLLRVIKQSRFDVLPEDYAWWPMKADEPPAREALACVRDGSAWHQFVPAPAGGLAQRYRVVSFHFKEGTDAAGFVAWLAAHLKRSAGTGAVVICGKDRRDTPELFKTILELNDRGHHLSRLHPGAKCLNLAIDNLFSTHCFTHPFLEVFVYNLLKIIDIVKERIVDFID